MSKYKIGKDIASLENRVEALEEQNSAKELNNSEDCNSLELLYSIDLIDIFGDDIPENINLRTIERFSYIPVNTQLTKVIVNLYEKSPLVNSIISRLSISKINYLESNIEERKIIEFFEINEEPFDIFSGISKDEKFTKYSVCKWGRLNGGRCKKKETREDNIDCEASSNRCKDRGNFFCYRDFVCYRRN